MSGRLCRAGLVYWRDTPGSTQGLERTRSAHSVRESRTAGLANLKLAAMAWFWASCAGSSPCLPGWSNELRISTVSGEELVLAAAELDGMVEEFGSTVISLKRHLAQKHFRKYSRFQLRILQDGTPEELKDEEVILPAPAPLRLTFLDHLKPDEDRDWRFRDSCVKGQVDEVLESLKALQNPNLDGGHCLALVKAVQLGQEELASLLLEGGASTETTDGRGNRSLHHAATSGKQDIVRLLLTYGADVEAMNMAVMTPLHLAARGGHLELVRLLLASSAQIEAKDTLEARALHWAAKQGHSEVVRLLLASGAEANATDLSGKTALQMAREAGHKGVLELLGP